MTKKPEVFDNFDQENNLPSYKVGLLALTHVDSSNTLNKWLQEHLQLNNGCKNSHLELRVPRSLTFYIMSLHNDYGSLYFPHMP